MTEEILQRYMSGEASQEETAAVEGWMAQDGVGRASGVRAMRAFAVAEREAAGDTGRRWVAISERLAASNNTNVSRKAAPWKNSKIRAAALASLILITFAALKSSDIPFTSFASTSYSKTYETENGQRATVSLGDGTNVTLAPGSRLTFTSRRGSNPSHTAVLEGEAVFDVAHSAAAPFSVRAGNIITTVLGTRFSVRKYPEDADVRIVVAEGKVSAQGNVLSKGDVMYVAEGDLPDIASMDDVTHLLAWTTGTLAFDNATLAEALPALSRWYDVDFVMSDPSLGARRLTTTLDDTGLTYETLTLISQSLGIRFTRVGRTITLYPGK